MIDKTEQLTTDVNELHAAIDALPDVKNIEINITGRALETITAIRTDLDALDDRTIAVNIVYKNIGGPEDIKNATQVINQVVVPASDNIKEQTQIVKDVTENGGGPDLDPAASEQASDAMRAYANEVSLAAERVKELQEADQGATSSLENLEQMASVAADNVERVKTATEDTADAARDSATQNASLAAAIDEVRAKMGDENLTATQSAAILSKLAYAEQVLAGAMRDAGDAADVAAGSGGEGGGGIRGAGAAAGDAGDNARSGAVGWGLWGLALTGTIGHIGLWHIALDGAVEALIAVGLASAAMTIGLAAMASTAIDVKNHIQAVNDVNSALGDQIPVLGADFRNFAESVGNSSKVLEIYGGAINAVSGQTGVLAHIGSEVVTMFDDWIAKIDIWVQGQGTFGKMLQSGVGFLHQFGTILGEVGIAIDNLVKSDPGTAHFLLDFFEGAGKVLDVITSLPQPILEVALGLHSLYVWGNFASGALGAILKFVPGMETLAGVFSRGFGLSDLISPLGLVVGAIGAVVYEWYHLNDAAKTTVNNMLTELNQLSASQAILQISNDIQTLQSKMSQTFSQQNFQQIEDGWKSVGGTLGAFGDYAINAGRNISKLNSDIDASHYESTFKDLGHLILGFFGNSQTAAVEASQQWAIYDAGVNKLLGDQKNLFTVMGDLTSGEDKFGIATHSVTDSLALMDLAGVQAGDSIQLMLQKVNNLVTGYQAMSVQGGILNGAVQAVTFSAEQQQSKITALTSAYSAWFSMLTGGLTGFDSFYNDMTKLDSAYNLNTKNLGGLTQAQVSAQGQFLSTAQDAQTQFNALVTMASASGLGAKGTAMLTSAMKDYAALLIPAAKGNVGLQSTLLGLVQEVNPNITSFKQLTQWVGNVRDPMGSLDKITNTLAADSANLKQDVNNLATALHQDLNNAMAQVILTETGGLKPMENLASAIQTTGLNSKTTQTDALTLAQQFVKLTGNVGDAHDEFITFAEKALNLTQQQANNLWNEIKGQLAPAVDNLGHDTVAQAQTAFESWAKNGLDVSSNSAHNLWSKITGELGPSLDNMGNLTVPSVKSKFIDWAENGLGLSQTKANNLYNELKTLQGQINSMHGTSLTLTETGVGHFSISEAAAGANVGAAVTQVATNLGKALKKAQHGIMLPGYGGGDIIPAMLEPGELVVPKEMAKHIGPALGFSSGGYVPNYNEHGVMGNGSVQGMGPWNQNNYNALQSAFTSAMESAMSSAMQSAESAALASLASGPLGGATGSEMANGAELYQYLLQNVFGGHKIAAAGAIASIWGESEWNPFAENCLPLTYKVVTTRGILSHDEVRIGDRTPVYNPKTGQIEDAEILAVPYHDNAPICVLGNQEWSVICTVDHRWITSDGEMVRAYNLKLGESKIMVGDGHLEAVEFNIFIGQADTFCLTTSTGTWTAYRDEQVAADEMVEPGPFWTGNTGGRGLIGWTPAGTISNAAFSGGMKTQEPAIIAFINSSGDEGVIREMESATSVLEAANLWGKGVERYGINDVHAEGLALATSIMNSGGSTAPAQGLSNAIAHATRSTQDGGGWIYPGMNLVRNNTGQIERTYPPGQGPEGGNTLHATFMIDGKQVFEALAPIAYQKAARQNGNANASAYWAPGNKR